MHSKHPTREISLPIVMAIGVSAEFFARSTSTVVLGGAVLMDASILEAAGAVHRWRPSVLLLTEDLYSFDPPQFDLLADSVVASIAIMRDESEDEEILQTRIERGLAEAGFLRRARDERETLPVKKETVENETVENETVENESVENESVENDSANSDSGTRARVRRSMRFVKKRTG